MSCYLLTNISCLYYKSQLRLRKTTKTLRRTQRRRSLCATLKPAIYSDRCFNVNFAFLIKLEIFAKQMKIGANSITSEKRLRRRFNLSPSLFHVAATRPFYLSPLSQTHYKRK